MIKITIPSLDKREEKAVIEVLRSGMLAQGEKVALFENNFAKFIGTKYAVATSSGTAALHLSLLALGIKEGDEVITTSFTFIASSNSILYTGAKPVFVDINPNTFNIDPDLIEEKITAKTKAIMPVHLYGLPADMDKILKIAKKNNLFIIEDAAQAHGSKIGHKLTGSFGDISAFSFYSTKNMTTGEGGMITTNDNRLAKKIKMLRNHGMEKRYHHEMLGFNFRMTNIQAAIGLYQLKKLNLFNKTRVKNAEFLTKKLLKIKQIQIPLIPDNYTHVFHQYTILVKDGSKKRNQLSEYLTGNGIENIVYYPLPVHNQEFMKKMYGGLKLKNTKKAANCALSLPVHPSLNQKDLQKIVLSVKTFFSND